MPTRKCVLWPNEKVKLRGRLVGRNVVKSRNAGPVNFNDVFGGTPGLFFSPLQAIEKLREAFAEPINVFVTLWLLGQHALLS